MIPISIASEQSLCCKTSQLYRNPIRRLHNTIGSICCWSAATPAPSPTNIDCIAFLTLEVTYCLHWMDFTSTSRPIRAASSQAPSTKPQVLVLAQVSSPTHPPVGLFALGQDSITTSCLPAFDSFLSGKYKRTEKEKRYDSHVWCIISNLLGLLHLLSDLIPSFHIITPSRALA